MGEAAKNSQCNPLPAARALALNLVSKTDLMRLKVLARLHARGLSPEVDWSDLLQEAFRRVLDGSRTIPDEIPFVAFLSEVMRSIKADFWKRAKRDNECKGQSVYNVAVAKSNKEAFIDAAPCPEQMLIAIEDVIAIETLFVDDIFALQIIAGLYEGLSGSEICSRFNISQIDYESTRKRMRRLLIKEHLRMPQP